MESMTAAIMMKALDGLSARSIVTAQNIANGGTPGYRPWRLSFERALADAAGAGEAAVRSVAPTVDRAPIENGDGAGDLRLDLELATANATALRYGALIDMLGRQAQLAELVASGGNG